MLFNVVQRTQVNAFLDREERETKDISILGECVERVVFY
jgi:hypothetical protein